MPVNLLPEALVIMQCGFKTNNRGLITEC